MLYGVLVHLRHLEPIYRVAGLRHLLMKQRRCRSSFDLGKIRRFYSILHLRLGLQLVILKIMVTFLFSQLNTHLVQVLQLILPEFFII